MNCCHLSNMADKSYMRNFSYLFLLLLTTNNVLCSQFKPDEDSIVFRLLDQFDEDVLRAAAQVTIEDCLCQCHWRTFRDRYRKQHGNCKSTDQTGAKWCYVRTDLTTYLGNHGHSTCKDVQRSRRYQGWKYSYHACTTPYLNDDVCEYLLHNYRDTHNNHNFRNKIKPRIAPDSVEGKFRDENGTITEGNKWVSFGSVITLQDSNSKFIGDFEVGSNENPVADDSFPQIQDSTADRTEDSSNNKENGDAVNFGLPMPINVCVIKLP